MGKLNGKFKQILRICIGNEEDSSYTLMPKFHNRMKSFWYNVAYEQNK